MSLPKNKPGVNTNTSMIKRLPDSPLARMLAAGEIRMVELAAASGTALTSLRRIAHEDVRSMRVDTLLRVSAAMGCAPAELIPMLGIRPKGGLLKERGVKR